MSALSQTILQHLWYVLWPVGFFAAGWLLAFAIKRWAHAVSDNDVGHGGVPEAPLPSNQPSGDDQRGWALTS